GRACSPHNADCCCPGCARASRRGRASGTDRYHQPSGPRSEYQPRRLVQRLRCVRRRSEEHTSELQSRENLVCRLLLEKKNGWRAHASNLQSIAYPVSSLPCSAAYSPHLPTCSTFSYIHTQTWQHHA